ncbi:MAG: hypothetical protein HZA72_00190 [Candidatus Omnitrophica bacterium]|nr:hypothetical protein [Candidatus Omnitrophota bacterium]
MARQKKFKKIQIPKGAKEFMLKKALGIIILIIFAAFVLVLAKAFLERSDYFRLKSVEAKGAAETSLVSMRSELLSRYKDRNIFKIDIKSIASGLEPRYPDAKDIVVKRVLPDKLLVDLKFRRPCALLSNGTMFPVDREGVVLVNMDPSRPKGLPVIKGVDHKLAGRAHKRCASAGLLAALDLLDEIRRARFLEKYNVRVIDAGDIRSLSFYLGENGPAVIIGNENYRERLIVLRETLRNPTLLLDSINYIDLRFKDVVISPK